MDLDPYQICPCGGGKKIKFCCSKDIITDLDKVLRVLEGEQRAAGLQQLDQLLAKHGDRDALLALKATTEMQQDQWEDAKETTGKFLAKAPNNPLAMAQTAMVELSEDQIDEAVTHMQRAIEQIDNQMPFGVYESIGAVAQALLSQGKVPAARAHLVLQASLSGQEDSRPASMLMRIHSSSEIPMMLKEDVMFVPCQDDVAWREEFDAAQKLSNRGCWLAAAEKLQAINDQHPDQPAILKNLALLRLWLGDEKTSAEFNRRYAALSQVEQQDAVEAEAMAQLTDPDEETDEIDVVTTTYQVDNTERLMELLLSDRRATKMPVDPHMLGDEDNPPPKGVFWLLDRPQVDSGAEIKRDEIPNVLGEMYLFGKQTDRDARLEFTVQRDETFDDKLASLSELLGESLGQQTEQETTDSISKLQATLTWNWRLPEDTPREKRDELIEQQRAEMILQRWPQVAQNGLDGKTPAEAAGDAALHVRLLASILLLELAGRQNRWKFDFNQLRQKLNLPLRETINPEVVEVKRLPLVRLSQLEVEKLSDDDLAQSYVRAGRSVAIDAVRKLAAEIVNRDSMADKINKSEAYEVLARFAENGQQSIDYIRQARQAATESGGSPAPFLISEMAMQLEQGNAGEFERLLNEVRNRHINEPGVAQMLMETLASYGLVGPDGRPTAPPQQAAPAQQEAEAGGKLWTPDSDTPAAGEGGQEKSKLWVPGMD